MLVPVGFGPLKSWAAGTWIVFESAVSVIPQGDTAGMCQVQGAGTEGVCSVGMTLLLNVLLRAQCEGSKGELLLIFCPSLSFSPLEISSR